MKCQIHNAEGPNFQSLLVELGSTLLICQMQMLALLSQTTTATVQTVTATVLVSWKATELSIDDADVAKPKCRVAQRAHEGLVGLSACMCVLLQLKFCDTKGSQKSFHVIAKPAFEGLFDIVGEICFIGHFDLLDLILVL